LIDSLRGIAALSVALFHLTWASFRGFEDTGALHFIGVICQWGYLGVPVFFIISGFVIAATIKPLEVNLQYIGKFALKRAIRLDPPYWLSMAVDISFLYITIHVFHKVGELPSISKVLAHIFYLQGLLGIRNIAAMYWTLCLEVQFYLFLCLVFAISRRASHINPRFNLGKYLVIGIFTITVFLSLLITTTYISNPIQGLFLSHWYLFALGATCYWASITRQVPQNVFYFFCICTGIAFIIKMQQDLKLALETFAGLITVGLIFIAATKGKMSVWLNNKTLLYLGSISYSLYLFHAIVGERFIGIIQEWLLPKLGIHLQSNWAGILLFIGATAVSIIASHLVFLLVEKPSVKISKAIKPGSRSSLFNDLRGNKLKYDLAETN
jgi:peptidoglycan/LPS O-acetylase OafA/YrhL